MKQETIKVSLHLWITWAALFAFCDLAFLTFLFPPRGILWCPDNSAGQQRQTARGCVKLCFYYRGRNASRLIWCIRDK